jgi:hypothetical protein
MRKTSKYTGLRLFRPTEITDLKSLSGLLEGKDMIPQYLRNKLQPGTLGLLSHYNTTGVGEQSLREAIACDFSAMIGGPLLCNSQIIDGIPRPKIRKAAAKVPLIGQALARVNRMILEWCLNGTITVRFLRAKQKRIRVGVGMFRIEGEDGIHGKIKIKGKSYSQKLTNNNDPKAAKTEYEKWVVEKRAELEKHSAKKGTLKSHFMAMMATRQKDVDLGKIKTETLPKLQLQSEHLEAHWPHWANLDVSELTADILSQLRKHLLHSAKNRSIKEEKKAKGLSKGTYNSYIAPIRQTLTYLRTVKVISMETYHILKDELKYAKVPARKVTIPTAAQLKTMRAYLYRVRQGPKCGDAGPKFDLMMLTGARLRTANAAIVDHYNPTKRTLLFTRLKAKAGEPTEKELPVCDELANLLERLIVTRGLKGGDHFFAAGNNNRAFNAAAKKAGIDRWFHHACRDWFGTMVFHQNHDPVNTAELLCHNDKGVTFLKVYRQVCIEHLQSIVRPLKMLPGAKTDSTLGPVLHKAQNAIAKFSTLPHDKAMAVLDRVLWMEERIDVGDFEAIAKLPELGQKKLPIYSRGHDAALQAPSLQLIKSNVRHLIAAKGVYHSDVTAATGIPRAVIAVVARTGEMQARYLPALCKYFEVPIEVFLGVDLAHPAPQHVRTVGDGEHETEAANPRDSKEDLTVEDLLPLQSQSQICTIVARNLESLMLEKNLTPHSLSLLSSLSGSVVNRLVREEVLMTEETGKKLAAALGVPETELYDPKRDNIVVIHPVFRANVEAIVAHYGISSVTYFVRLKLDNESMQAALKTGDFVPSQVHRLVEAEGKKFTVRQLVSEDLTSLYPPAIRLDPAVISRNLMSICWERGIYPAELTKIADVSVASALNYAAGKSDRIDRELLTRVAAGLGLSLEELANGSRPEVKPTPYFQANLAHFIKLTGLRLTPLSEACGMEARVIRSVLNGTQPNPHQLAKLAGFFGLTCRELLSQDLTSRDLLGTDSNPTLQQKEGGTQAQG